MFGYRLAGPSVQDHFRQRASKVARGLAARKTNSDFESTRLGMEKPPNLVYATVYVKMIDVSGT